MRWFVWWSCWLLDGFFDHSFCGVRKRKRGMRLGCHSIFPSQIKGTVHQTTASQCLPRGFLTRRLEQACQAREGGHQKGGNRHQPKKSPSNSVGARVVDVGRGGPSWSPVLGRRSCSPKM